MLSLVAAPRADEGDCADCPLSLLPPDLFYAVLSLCPLQTRLLSRSVCRCWRSLLEDASFWTEVDWSVENVDNAFPSPGLLHAVSVRAKGQMRALLLAGQQELDLWALLSVLHANRGSLTLLDIRGATHKGTVYSRFKPVRGFEHSDIETLLSTAPGLRELRCDVTCTPMQARALLRGKPRMYAPVRLGGLHISFYEAMSGGGGGGGGGGGRSLAMDPNTFAAAAAGHPSLSGLTLSRAPLSSASAAEAVAELALACKLRSLDLAHCDISSAALPALSNLLVRSESLQSLSLSGRGDVVFLDAARTAAFCAALRASKLLRLSLSSVRLFDSVPDGLAVLDACTAHPTLASLHLHSNDGRAAQPHPAFGDALSKLVSSPSKLRALSLAGCRLTEADAKRVFTALGGSGLTGLDMSGNCMGEAFGRAHVLPAVEENRGLRSLTLSKHLPALVEASARVQARA